MLFVKKNQVKFFNIIFFVGLITLISCNKNTITYIQTTPVSNNPSISQIDSFSGVFTVYRLDSFQTNRSPDLFVGYHQDPVFGKTQCGSYIRFLLPTTTPPINTSTTNAAYDSMQLIIYVGKASYGDTTSTINVSAYRVNQDISQITSIGQVIYNNDDFSTEPTPLGSTKRVGLRPNNSDTIVIRLNDSLGRQIFNFYLNNSPNVASNTAFSSFFNGIKLLTDVNQTNAIYSFKNNGFVMRMYYHTDIGYFVQQHIDFGPGNNAYQSYTSKTDRTGTVLAALDQKPIGNQLYAQISSTALGNKFYMQELTGVRTRVDFPSLQNVLQQGTFVKVLQAQFNMAPAGNPSTEYPLSSAVNLYLGDQNNNLTGRLLFPGTSVAETGSLVIDNLYGRNTMYTYDVTAYVNSQLTSNTYTSRCLIPIATDSLSRIVCGSSSNLQYTTQLVVSTLIYQK